MNNQTIFYTNHAVQQMFQRNITTLEVENVLLTGETIMNYPDDKPLPSSLLFSLVNSRPLHVVCSSDVVNLTTIVITAYEPSTDIWNDDYKTRKKQ